MLSLERQNALREQFRQRNPDWQPATEVYAKLVRRNLRREDHLLDLGCGRGGLVEQLGHSMNQVAGVDPDWLSLSGHRLAGHDPPFARAVALGHELPFADESFELIVSSWVLEHLTRPEGAFCEIGRVLRPGGLFVFLTPNKRHPLAGFNRLASRISGLQDRLVERIYGRAPSDAFPAYYRANSASELEPLASSAKLELTYLQAIPDPTYLAFFPSLFRVACWLEARLPAERHIHLVGCLKKSI